MNYRELARKRLVGLAERVRFQKMIDGQRWTAGDQMNADFIEDICKAETQEEYDSALRKLHELGYVLSPENHRDCEDCFRFGIQTLKEGLK